jgi:hypothetical protein
MYPSSATPDTGYIAWFYTGGTASGSAALGVPANAVPGTGYQLRLFTNDSFSRLATSGAFTVSRPRFVDNGDGTVSDTQTGLMWEKKTGVIGSDVFCGGLTPPSVVCTRDPHNVNNVYRWSATGTAPDGSAFTLFLASLNGGATGVGNCVSNDGTTQTGGFAGHCDWRLPTTAELRTIVTSPGSCARIPCIDPIFGPTQWIYSSSTTLSSGPTAAWFVLFSDEPATELDKLTSLYVRAVRGGS